MKQAFVLAFGITIGALIAVMICDSDTVSAHTENSRWTLVTMHGGTNGYQNFAWRINNQTGRVNAFRVAHSDKDGFGVELIVLGCGDTLLDAAFRGEISIEQAAAKYKDCQ